MLAERLSRCFGGQVRARGEEYASDGRVRNPKLRRGVLKTTVRGSVYYEVRIERPSGNAWRLRADCSCPYADDALCKHIWATLVSQESIIMQFWGAPPKSATIVLADSEEGEDDEEEENEQDIGADPHRRGPGELALSLDWPASQRRVSGGSAAHKQRLAGAKPKAPPWKRLLEETRRYSLPVGAAGLSRSEPPIPGTVWYVVDEERSSQMDALVVELMRSDQIAPAPEQPAQDQPAPPAPRLSRLSITASDVARIEQPDDRSICALLVGAARPTRETFAYSTYGGSDARSAFWQLDPTMLGVIMQAMAGTSRLAWRRSGQRETEPASWRPDAPWELAIELRPIAAGPASRAELRPVVRRGDCGEVLSLRDVSVTIPGEPGVVMHGGEIAPLRVAGGRGGGLLRWATSVARRPLASIKQGEIPALLDALNQKEIRLPITWPEGWGPKRVTDVRPRHRLALTTPRSTTKRDGVSILQADVQAIYEGVPAGPEAGNYVQTTLPDGSHALIQRDAGTEQMALDRFLSLGGKRDPYARQFHAPVRRVPEIVTTLLREGWEVVRDASTYRRPGTVSVRVTSGVDWFDLEGAVEFDGASASIGEVLAAQLRGDRFVTLGDGSLGLMPEQWLAKHGRWLALGRAEDGNVRFSRAQISLVDALANDIPEVTCDAAVALARKKLRGFTGIKPRREPRTFRGTLRPYQREGLAWLAFLADFGLGGCLADDMGLGKTVQLLAHLADRRAKGDAKPWLVVAPKSLVTNWAREAQRFVPGLGVIEHTGTSRTKHADDLRYADLVLTTYATMRLDIELLRQLDLGCAVLDEAQAIKNSTSQAAKASRLLRADRRLALTGTPVENRLGDLWSIFEFLNPGMLGTSGAFREAAAAREDGSGTDVLRRALRPFLLRRTKASVAPELPPRSEQTVRCELEGKQRTLYEGLRNRYRQQLLGRIDRDGMKNSRMHILEALLRLRQAACHSALIEPKRAPRSRGAAGESAKLTALCDMLSELVAEGHKALVFSQFTSLLALVRAELDERGIIYEQLDGTTSAKKRAERIDRFQSPASGAGHPSVFLISLKAGGVGLNLTAAGYVFLLDPWWNPAVEAQAIDRAHRIGQDKSVIAYRLIAAGTVEERILELQERKRELAAAIVSENAGPLSSMTRDDLEWLLS